MLTDHAAHAHPWVCFLGVVKVTLKAPLSSSEREMGKCRSWCFGTQSVFAMIPWHASDYCAFVLLKPVFDLLIRISQEKIKQILACNDNIS